jgi:hypothetical protein
MIFSPIAGSTAEPMWATLADVRRKQQKEVALSRKLTLLTILTLALCATASADVLYTTLGPQDQYDPNNGWYVDGSDYTNQVLGMPFVPNETTTMTDAVLALGHVAGNNTDIGVYLYTDSNGLPGTQLATLTQQSEIQDFFTGGGLVQFSCNDCGQVVAGTHYWLVAQETDPDSQQAWMYSYQLQQGEFAVNKFGSRNGPWNLFPGTLSGYLIDGASTPEPGTIVLLGSGLVTLIGTLRRKL